MKIVRAGSTLGAQYFAVLLAATSAVQASAAGPAFSGIFASADSAETVYNNPAGMTRLKGTQMTGQAIFIKGFSKFEVDEGLTSADGGNPRDSDPAIVPAFYYQREYRDDWRLGASVNIPTGFGSNNGPNWAGRYYSDEFTLFYLTISPALAYKVTEELSIGVGASAVYTSSETSTRVNNEPFLPGAQDGRLESESDGVGFGFSLSALYQFNDNTRVGLSYRSESDADLDTKLEFKNVMRPPGVIEELEGQTIKIGNSTPATVGAGIYHRLDNDWALTFDLIWMEFSEFGVTEITLSDNTIDAPKDIYDDFFAGSVGISWPVNDRMRASFGAVYIEQPVPDENRSFGIALDEMWGLGGGVSYQLQSGDGIELNVNFIDTGESPIDTGPDAVKGRVAGESDDHYAITVDFSYHWR
jgi:long-chain fatty acid transport protein